MNLVDQNVLPSPKLCEPAPSPELSVDQESIPITAPSPTPSLVVQETVPIPASPQNLLKVEVQIYMVSYLLVKTRCLKEGGEDHQKIRES